MGGSQASGPGRPPLGGGRLRSSAIGPPPPVSIPIPLASYNGPYGGPLEARSPSTRQFVDKAQALQEFRQGSLMACFRLSRLLGVAVGDRKSVVQGRGVAERVR